MQLRSGSFWVSSSSRNTRRDRPPLRPSWSPSQCWTTATVNGNSFPRWRQSFRPRFSFFVFQLPVMSTAAVDNNASKPKQPREPSLIDWLKPRKGVAKTRLKNNGFMLIVVLVVTTLLPVVPSPWTCLWILFFGPKNLSSWVVRACYTGVSRNYCFVHCLT